METRAKHFRKRDAILTCLRSTETHPSAEWIYENVRQEIPDISLATVYRNLAMFKDQGIITSLGTVGGVERFDANTKPHVHFVCDRCDAVIALHQIPMPRYNREECGGCHIESCSLTFTGICGSCQN